MGRFLAGQRADSMRTRRFNRRARSAAILDITVPHGPSFATDPNACVQSGSTSGYTGRGHQSKDKFTALVDAWRDSHRDDWQADGGLPISAAALEAGRSFLAALPDPVPEADIRPSLAGYITLNWQKAPNRVFTVSIGEGPEVLYAGLSGRERVYGRVPLEEMAVPQRILDELNRFHAAE